MHSRSIKSRFATGKDHWFRTTDEVNGFTTAFAAETKREPVPGEDYTLDEWHDLKSLNRAMAKLKSAGFEPGDLVPLPRIAGREPPVRFTLEHEGSAERSRHAPRADR